MFQSHILEIDQTLICQQHNSPITIIVTEQNFKGEERLQCEICWKNNQHSLHTTPYQLYLEKIKEQQDDFCKHLNIIIMKNLSMIEQLKDSINQIKTQFSQKLKDCEEKITIWNTQLMELGNQNSQYSIYNEINMLVKNQSKMNDLLELIRNIKSLNNDYSSKIQPQLNNVMDTTKYDNCLQHLLDINQMDILELIDSSTILTSITQNIMKKKSLCQVHNQEIVYVDKSQNVDIEQRTSCLKCNRRVGDILEDFLKQWEIYCKDGKQQLKDEFYDLKSQVQFSNNILKSIKQDICQIIDEKIDENIKILKSSYNKYYSGVWELNNLLNQEGLNNIALKLSMEESYQVCKQIYNQDNGILMSKINYILQQLENYTTKYDVKTIEYQDINSINQNKNQNKDQNECDDYLCLTIAFNNSNTIMLSGLGEKIKSWLFIDGQLVEVGTLVGHTDNVSCLVFSKYSNSFVSGALDYGIKVWKEKTQFKWEGSQLYIQHFDFISCLILSQDEDFLFSGSHDRTIRIWKLDFTQNLLQQVQCLEYHTNQIFSMSINNSQSQLVSCGQDKQIILWEKGNNNQWQFKHKIEQSIQDFGYRIQFISDTQFIWLNKGKNGYICFFELDQGIFIEKQNKQIDLGNDDFEDEDFFPIWYNHKIQVIFVKHKKTIYTFKKDKDDNINLITKIQIFNHPKFYGQFTNNGKYLVAIYQKENKNQQQFIIKQLEYK
ncbi:unnamed protein product [Paramecium primaurelia]|uniref:WD40-repeat-containing domain n=1 Tax=Paramecium primaurelia TaxID=5886 RepID=A0A8S1MLW7_PARPR|nr:unnamed protein product [Paramecium primaurelia]